MQSNPSQNKRPPHSAEASRFQKPQRYFARGLRRLGLARIRLGELAAEALDAASRVDQLLLAGKERVARRADFQDDIALVRGTRLEARCRRRTYSDVVIIRVNSLFWHREFLSHYLEFVRLADRLQRSNSRHIEGPVAQPCAPVPFALAVRAFHQYIGFPHPDTSAIHLHPDLRYWKAMARSLPHLRRTPASASSSENGRQVAAPCVCRIQQRAARMLERARIPQRYEHCSLENYDTHFPSANRTLTAAHLRARRFVEGYPVETDGTGLLLTGSIGVGKTHLAVGILQALVAERGATGLFYDYRDLLKQVQNSYNRNVLATELEILAPSSKPKSSSSTNSAPPSPPTGSGTPSPTSSTPATTTAAPPSSPPTTPTFRPLGTESGTSARAAMREETLGDRIGERMRSRLQEMCVVVEMQGEDFRQKVKRASFA